MQAHVTGRNQLSLSDDDLNNDFTDNLHDVSVYMRTKYREYEPQNITISQTRDIRKYSSPNNTRRLSTQLLSVHFCLFNSSLKREYMSRIN